MSTNAQDYLAQAEAAIAAGELDKAETLLKQAEMSQKTAAIKAATAEPVVRPVFGVTDAEKPAETGHTKAIEAAYVKKYGDIDASVAQIYRELYGSASYPMLRAAKMADTERYLRTGQADARLMKQVLLSPSQVVAAIAGGVPVADGNFTIKATMIEAQDTLGGYLLIEEYNQEMVQRLPGLTAIRPRARKFNTSRDALSFMVRTGGTKQYIGNVRSKQTSESPSAGTFDTNATFGKIAIPVHVNLSKVPVSKSLLEDASMNIMSEVLMPEFASEAAIKEDRQFIFGTGADEPQGILNPANGYAPFNSDVSTQNSGDASTLTFDALVKAPYKLAGQYRAKKPSVAWVFTSTTAGVIAGLKDGQGRYLWTEANGNNAVGAPDTLRGWNVAETESAQEIAANAYPVIFGDFEGYRIVDRIGMSVERYSDSATADTDTVVFFCRRRYGGQVAEGYRLAVIKVATPLN